ncbi:MAG: hypothetical protein ABSB41_00985 [Anaerolineales bacterium]|jgi:hypothetical protein
MTKKDSYGHNQGYTSNAEADKAAAEEKAKVYKNTHPRGTPAEEEHSRDGATKIQSNEGTLPNAGGHR